MKCIYKLISAVLMINAISAQAAWANTIYHCPNLAGSYTNGQSVPTTDGLLWQVKWDNTSIPSPQTINVQWPFNAGTDGTLYAIAGEAIQCVASLEKGRFFYVIAPLANPSCVQAIPSTSLCGTNEFQVAPSKSS